MKTIKIIILGLLIAAFLFIVVNTASATITYNAGTNLITLDDSAGAGDSWGTAYDMDDVLTNCGAVVTKQGADAYDISARMQFNDGVYFVSESEFVEVKPNPAACAWTWRAQTGSHLKFGYYDATDKFCCKGSFWKVYVDSTTTSGGNYYRGETLIYGSTMWNDANSYTDAISFEPFGTTKVYDSVMSGKAYMRTTDIDFRNVRWINNDDVSFALMVASGYDYAWSGITTIKGTNSGGIFMSGTTTSAVDLYDVTFQDCDKDVMFSSGCNWLLRLINSPTFSTCTSPGSGKPGMKLCYTFNCLVTNNTNAPLGGALVVLKDNTGSTVFSLNTQGDGKLSTEQIVTQKSYRNAADGGTVDYNPHTLKITLNGYSDYETDITIDHKIEDDQICLDALTYTFDDIIDALDEIKGGSFTEANDSLYNISNKIDDIDDYPSLTIKATTGAFYSLSSDMAIFIIAQDNNNNLTSATITVSIYNETGVQVSTGNAVAISTGRYKYTFSIPSDATLCTYRVDANATDGTNTAHDTTSFITSENLPFIIEDDGTIIIKKSGFGIMALFSIPSVLFYFYKKKKKREKEKNE